jgi:hypothetical protein
MNKADYHQTPEGQPSATMNAPLLIDKEDVLKVLNDLTANFPSEEIPFEVIEKALARFTAPRDIGRLKGHPSIDRLDQVLAQHKISHTS